MKVFSRPSTNVTDRVAQMQAEYHPDLKDVTVDALFVFDDEKSSAQVLNHQGYGAAAVIRITGVRDRALGMADAVITIDRATWVSLSAASRDALVDHELQHLVWDVDREGHPKSDALGRPKLRIRKHDRQFGWFDEIAQRHGEASIEVQQAKLLLSEARQFYFEFGPIRAPGLADREQAVQSGRVDPATGELLERLQPARLTARADSEPSDELYDRAVGLVITEGNTSISFLQRYLLIGYNRAARLLEAMEAAGVVGPLQSDLTRQVVATKADAPSTDGSNVVNLFERAAAGSPGDRVENATAETQSILERLGRSQPPAAQ